MAVAGLTPALSQAGETLDALCWRLLGSTAAFDAVYAANPGIAALGAVLPTGTAVAIPDALAGQAGSVSVLETVKLWS
jgi:phage tail protein X